MNRIAYFLVFLLYSIEMNGQGCSDAGVCSSGKSSNTSNDTISSVEVKLGATIGKGEQGVTIFQGYAGVGVSLFKKVDLEIKVPYQFATGNLGSNTGAGDITTSLGLFLFERSQSKLYISAGLRLPTGRTDEGNGKYASWPMPYQTGLGTTDILTGLNYYYHSWKFSAGYQYILNQNNKNQFINSNYSDDTPASAYFSSPLLSRGNDLLLRIDKSFNYSKWSFQPGVIYIYRVQEDKILTADESLKGVAGSDGGTLNLSGAIKRMQNNYLSFSLNFGFPVLVREVRPDGLTRSMVTGIEVSYLISKKK